MEKFILTKKEIENAKEKSSCVKEMLDLLNVKYGTLYARCKKYNISLADFRIKWNFDYDKFMDLYNKGLTDPEISEIIKIPSKRVCDYRNKLGLEPNFLKEIELTDDQYQIIIGGLLGDSCMITPNRTETPYLIFGHSPKQKDYCKWKFDQMQPLFKSFFLTKEFDKRTNKIYYLYTAHSRQNKCLWKFYNMFYKIEGDKKIKYINKEMLNSIKPLGLAIWFQDDGFKATGNGYYLATNCFTKSEIKMMQDMFLYKYNIYTAIHSDNRLYIKSKSAQLFENLIIPYIQDCCKYKLHSRCKTPLNGETPKMDNPVLNPLEIKENA